MLKHGRIFPRKTAWGARHLRWLQEQIFDHPAHQIALQEMVEAVRISKERVVRLEAAIEEFVPTWSLAPVVRALQALRGVDLIVAVTFTTEIGDMRRFDNPRQLMSYLGLVPSERSSGDTIRRGGLTKAGNGRVRHMLVESAWTYRHPTADRQSKALPIRSCTNKSKGDRLEGADPAYGSLSCAQWAREEDDSDLRGDRSRARRLHVGRSQGDAIRLNAERLFAHRRRRDHGRGIPVRRFVAGLAPTPAVRSGQPRTHLGNAVPNPRIRA